MKNLLVLGIAALLFVNCKSVYHSSESNQACKVMLPTLAETYEGYCKDGKAHGEGVATGIHYYKGEFVDGYPQGEGTYVWHEGREYTGHWFRGMQNGFGILDSEENGVTEKISGFWVNGELSVISDDDRPYRITSNQGPVNTVLRKQSTDYEDNRVKLFIRRGGENLSGQLSGLNIEYSSGHLKSSSNGEHIIEAVSYPVNIYVTYQVPNLMGTMLQDVRVRVEIFEPGYWLIDLQNK